MSESRKTYSHLASQGRIPSEYDITTARLLYHPTLGFEVDVPLKDWYATHARKTRLVCGDWDALRDPRETTYARYQRLRAQGEAFVRRLFDFADEPTFLERIEPDWIERLAGILGPVRFLWHGLQMSAAYVGQMAPSGRLAILSLFQAADEMKRIQHAAYRLAQLRRTNPELGKDARSRWENAAVWQPPRRLVERLLVTYDFGEAFVALNACVKPLLDGVFLAGVASLAQSCGDDILARAYGSVGDDATWHAEWSRSVLQTLVRADASNRAAIEEWIARWLPETKSATEAVARLFGLPVERELSAAIADCAEHCELLGVRAP